MKKNVKYNLNLAKEYLLKGELLDCIQVRTGKGNTCGSVNCLNQLAQIFFDLNIKNDEEYKYIFYQNITNLKPKTEFVKFVAYWKKKGIQLIYNRNFIIIPYNSELGILLKLYSDNLMNVVNITLGKINA